MPLPGKTTYQMYIERAELCRWNSRRAESEWAKKFWGEVAIKLQLFAGNMPVSLCHKEAEILKKM